MIAGWEGMRPSGPGRDALEIFAAGLKRADPLGLIETCLRLERGPRGQMLVVEAAGTRHEWALADYDTIILLGYGKASARMALGVERLLGPRIRSGLVVTKPGHGEELSRAQIFEAGHPLPDAASQEAGRRILELAAEVRGERTLVVSCVSGGGSALLCAPGFGLSLEDKRAVNSLLLASGATIGEMNRVRKHLSLVKGGRLARAFAPSTLVNLILSDVMGDDLATIASGPTVPDPSTWSEALATLTGRGLLDRLPGGVRAVLERGIAGGLEETPKPGDPAFAACHNILVGTNVLSLEAAKTRAQALGYSVLTLTSRLEGEARELAQVFAAMAWDLHRSGLPLPLPACVLSGGESTVTLRGRGKGGRNQEMALAFLDAAADLGLGLEGTAFLACATDGNDGPTDAAGGLADAVTLAAVREGGLDTKAALADNASYQLLHNALGLVVTGPSGTNVCDLQVLVAR